MDKNPLDESKNPQGDLEFPLTIIVDSDEISPLMWSDYDSVDSVEIPGEITKEERKITKNSKTKSKKPNKPKLKSIYKNKSIKLTKDVLKKDSWIILEVEDIYDNDDETIGSEYGPDFVLRSEDYDNSQDSLSML
jgi:hypothetical protein